ncbi:MAG: GDSL-type esterase/lipase family protein [Aggregatilineales bacterium]
MLRVLRWIFPVLLWSIVIFIAAQTPPDARVIQMNTTLALHTEPNSNNPPVTFLEAETALYVVGRSADAQWLEVRTGSTIHGWVVADYITLDMTLASIPITDGSDPDAYFAPHVIANMREIYARGQERGNRPNVFSRVGDSITVSRNFLQSIGTGAYDVSAFPHLAPVIDYYSEQQFPTGNSFNRRSMAAKVGWAAWGVLSGEQSNAGFCAYQEAPLACEYRLSRPSVALIMFGTNDMMYRTTSQYRADLLEIIDLSYERGIIPVLSTIPPRPAMEWEVEQFNQVIREVTDELSLPLWDYGSQMAMLPNYGLLEDGIHPSAPPEGSMFTAFFTGQNMQYGYVVRNLSALDMLYHIWQTLGSE